MRAREDGRDRGCGSLTHGLGLSSDATRADPDGSSTRHEQQARRAVRVGELAPGLWWWTAPHPDWQPGRSWPADVRCFYAEAEQATLLIDPLVPSTTPERFWAALDHDVDRRGLPVCVLLTQAAHARSAPAIAARYGAEVWGPEQARHKVGGARFCAISPGDAVPGGRALPLEQEPGGSGAPLYLPSHGAVALGDVFIARGDRLHVWWRHGASDDAWYRERLLPSLRRWLDLPIEHLLVAHGGLVEPSELAAALEREPDRDE